MTSGRCRSVQGWFVVLLLFGLQADARADAGEVAADSLLIHYEETGLAPDVEVLPPVVATPWTGPRARFDAGVTPTTGWTRVGLVGGCWRLEAGRRLSAGGERTDLYLVREGDRIGTGIGRLALRGGAGLLLGGAGRSSAPSAGQSLRGGSAGWRTVRGEPSAGSLRGVVLALTSGGLTVQAVTGEGDRNGRLGGGGRTRQARLRLGGSRAAGSLLLLSEAAGEGVGVGVELGDARLDGVAEAAFWRPAPSALVRRAWTVHAALGGRALRLEAQAAVREAGFAPRPGRRPAVLGADDRRGWALRARGRRDGVAVALLLASARGEREIDDLPAYCDRTRRELLVSGRVGGVAWRARAADRVETVHGWSDRAPWLPAAEISARRTTRFDLRAAGTHGLLAWRVATGATGVSRRVAGDPSDAGWRRRLALRVDRPLGGGLTLRLNQVWAWGESVDLVSVEAPAPGLLRPRHWGRRDRERSLGLAWRVGGWRLTVAAAAWEGPADAGGAEVLARLVYAP